MKPNEETLLQLCLIKKLYETASRPVCEKHGITQTELDIIAFLCNHPDKDTASDIVQLRMLPKANVSQAVETLIQKQLLIRTTDREDRRRIHLSVTQQAVCIKQDIDRSRGQMSDVICCGFTEQEKTQFIRITQKINQNIEQYLKQEQGN